MVVGDQGSSDGLAECVVVPDHGGEGEDALRDPGADAGEGSAAVVFEVELAFEGVVDRLDDLAQGFEEAFAGSGGLAARVGRSRVIPASASSASNARP